MVTIFLLLLVTPLPLLGADSAAKSDEKKVEAKTGNSEQDNSSADAATPAVEEAAEGSVSARLRLIEDAIKTDQTTQKQLLERIEKRKKRFKSMSTRLDRVNKEIETSSKQLEALDEKTESAKAEALKQQLGRLEGDKALLQSQSDIEIKAEQTERTQLQILEKKIGDNKALLDELKGVRRPEPETAPVTAPTAPVPAVVEGATPVPTIPAIPGQIPQPSEDATQPGKPASELPETAEQIEARKEAEKREQEAKQAERAIEESVERKNLLEEQIKQAKMLLQTAEVTEQNYEKWVIAREQELKEKIAAGERKSVLVKLQKEIELVRNAIRENRKEMKARISHISDLHTQLAALQAQQLRAVKESEEKRKQAEDARRQSIWLESPFHPHNLLRWIQTRGPRILMVFVVIGFMLLVSRLTFYRLANLLVRRGRGQEESRVNRAQTLAISFRSVTEIIIIVGGVLLVLEAAGVDVKAVLGGAAIIGLAIAFGAQNLMRDYFTGFMILIEDQYELGDLVTVGDATGIVEKVNMRTTVLRDLEGRVHFIPNGQIRQVTNRTFEWARAVIEVAVAYKENVDQVMKLLMELANELRQDPEYRNAVLEEPVMLGVDAFGDAAVKIKFMMKTRPDQMWAVKRELLRRIKNRFDEEGIEIPIPQRIIFQHIDQVREPGPNSGPLLT